MKNDKLRKVKEFFKYSLFKDIKENKGLKTSVIVPYAIMLMPIIQTILFGICYLFIGSDPYLIGHMNSSFITAFPFFILLFIMTDAYKLFSKKKDITENNVKFNFKNYPEVFFLMFTLGYILLASFFHGNIIKDWKLFIHVEGETYQLQESPLLWLYYGICFTFSFLTKDKDTMKRIILVFLGVSIFNGIIAFADTRCVTPLTQSKVVWSGLFFNSNHYAYLICMTLIASVCLYFNTNKKGLKIFATIVFIFNTIISMFNNCFGSMLAVFIVLIIFPIVYSIYHKKFNWQYLLPLIIYIIFSFIAIPIAKFFNSEYTNFMEQLIKLFREIISILFNPLAKENESAGTNRWGLWVTSIKEILDTPLFGKGEYLFKPHNEYLQISQHSGVLTGIFYITALVIILVKSIKNFRALSKFTITLIMTIGVYLISALFGNTMPHTYPTFMVILAFGIKQLNADVMLKKNTVSTKENISTEETNAKVNKEKTPSSD